MADHLSPAAGRMVAEHNIDASKVDGTGRGGRVTKTDLVNHMESSRQKLQRRQKHLQLLLQFRQQRRVVLKRRKREPMSMLRRKIAESLFQHNRPLLCLRHLMKSICLLL